MDVSGSDLNIPALAARISAELPQRLEYVSFYNELQARQFFGFLRLIIYMFRNRILGTNDGSTQQVSLLFGYANLCKVATSEDVTLEDFPTSLLNQLTRRGLDTKLRNMVYYWLKEKCSSFRYYPLEPLDYMKKCQKCLFGDLTTGDPHFGLSRCNDGDLDATGSYSRASGPKLIYAQRFRLAETIIHRGLAPVAQEFLKKGCPPSLRSKIWQLILGSFVTHEHSEYYNELKQGVIKSDLIIDRLILKDVQLTAANDDQYFVFEDSLYQVLLCFTRDVTLLDLFDRSSKNPLTAQVKGKGKHVDTSVIYPPNGIVPFHGFTMYVAPLCYLYDDAETLFFTFRSLYMRYWYRLHEISSHEDGIIGLSILFEKLLHRHETQLWFHLRSLRVLP
ncbi:unnamed protein product [Orchesella dallaii]|uniref:Rab-GAP TBC domain-containing protein n=1 Tax=Orchesella dallaii TaxID=48710 RepID=A0ABP1R4J6_9HEXA